MATPFYQRCISLEPPFSLTRDYKKEDRVGKDKELLAQLRASSSFFPLVIFPLFSSFFFAKSWLFLELSAVTTTHEYSSL